MNTSSLWFGENGIKKIRLFTYLDSNFSCQNPLALWDLGFLLTGSMSWKVIVLSSWSGFCSAGLLNSLAGSNWWWTTCTMKTSRFATTLFWLCRSSWCTTGRCRPFPSTHTGLRDLTRPFHRFLWNALMNGNFLNHRFWWSRNILAIQNNDMIIF